ncbi:hypothetical protein [Paractinoplanes hotanensis]|uniref:Uncharacterized protein n=1 Tax=Paractinoplanes hotanensis TaxID=2906497 RepID=A0ABT0XZC7_9ACTN|nr:hypothetical protein [Actinoplanes hotanensis]MCM4078573.1 hypothetical protein [Actinoplanes hotanensis]
MTTLRSISTCGAYGLPDVTVRLASVSRSCSFAMGTPVLVSGASPPPGDTDQGRQQNHRHANGNIDF